MGVDVIKSHLSKSFECPCMVLLGPHCPCHLSSEAHVVVATASRMKDQWGTPDPDPSLKQSCPNSAHSHEQEKSFHFKPLRSGEMGDYTA